MHVLQLHLIRKCSSDVKHVHSCISKKLTYILWLNKIMKLINRHIIKKSLIWSVTFILY